MLVYFYELFFSCRDRKMQLGWPQYSLDVVPNNVQPKFGETSWVDDILTNAIKPQFSLVSMVLVVTDVADSFKKICLFALRHRPTRLNWFVKINGSNIICDFIGCPFVFRFYWLLTILFFSFEVSIFVAIRIIVLIGLVASEKNSSVFRLLLVRVVRTIWRSIWILFILYLHISMSHHSFFFSAFHFYLFSLCVGFFP